jgi:hypothetical protein
VNSNQHQQYSTPLKMNGTTVVSALSVQFGCCFVIAKYSLYIYIYCL